MYGAAAGPVHTGDVERNGKAIFYSAIKHFCGFGIKSSRRLEKAAPHDVYLLSHRTGPAEPGPEKSFNFSQQAVSERWDAGFLECNTLLPAPWPRSKGSKLFAGPSMER
jgi:hypothetical protein